MIALFVVATSLFDERVPLFDASVKGFLIGSVAFFIVAWLAFYVWGRLTGGRS